MTNKTPPDHAGTTPGTWQANGSHVYGPDPERHLVAQVLSGDGRLVADRDLIASAPDGLELAEWIAYHWANQDMNHADFRVEAFMRAEKVIARAHTSTPTMVENGNG